MIFILELNFLYFFKQHERTHSDLKLYQCELCGQEFKQRSTLNTHKMLHTEEKKYECPTCQKVNC